MKFSTKHKISIIIIAYLGIIWAAFTFFISPLIGQVSLKADKIQENIMDRESQAKRMAELSKLKEQFEMVEREENKIKVFLTKERAIDLIKNLESLADKTGNKISIEIDEKSQVVSEKDAKNPGIMDDLPKFNFMKLKITLTGSYNGMVNFMTKLENLDYYSDVISINMNQGESLGVSSSQDLFGQLNSSSKANEPVKPNLLKTELVGLFYLE